MKNYKFTIIAVATTGEHFKKTVDSILESTENLRETQLILCDTIGAKETTTAANKLSGFEGITLVDSKGLSEAESFNKALSLIKGEYTIFAEDGVIYNKDALAALYNASLSEDCHLCTAAVSTGKDGSKTKYANFPPKCSGKIDLTENFCFGHAALSAYAFVTEKIKGIDFDENIYDEYKKKFILESLCKDPLVYIIKNQSVFYKNALENDTDLNSFQLCKWYS